MRRIAFWLSLVLIFAIPWENSGKIDGLGSLAKLVGLAAAGAWFASIALRGAVRKLQAFHAVVMLFILWNLASVLWSVDIDQTFERAVTYVQTLVLVLMLWDVYRTPESLRAGMQAYVAGAFVCVGLLGHAYLFGGGATARRLTAEGFNPNVAAFGLVMAFPMAWYLARIDDVLPSRRWWRWPNLFYLPAASFAIILTGSRAAMGSALVAFLFMVLSLGRLRPLARVTFLAVVLAAPVVALPHLTLENLERIASTGDEVGDGSYGGRNAVWSEGMALVAARPWTGVGSGAFTTAAVETRKAPHNFVVSILVEIGVVGMVLFVAVLAGTGFSALGQDRWMCRLWLTLLLMWVMNSAVHNYEDKKHTWVFFSLVAIGAAMPQRAQAGGGFKASTRKAARQPSARPAVAPTAT